MQCCGKVRRYLLNFKPRFMLIVSFVSKQPVFLLLWGSQLGIQNYSMGSNCDVIFKRDTFMQNNFDQTIAYYWPFCTGSK